jgi:competence protein ComEC
MGPGAIWRPEEESSLLNKDVGTLSCKGSFFVHVAQLGHYLLLLHYFPVSSFLFYISCIGFCIGIFVRSFYTVGLVEVVWILSISLGLGVLWRRNRFAISAPFLLGASLLLLLFAFGIVRMEWASWYERDPSLEAQLDKTVLLEGVVVREPDIRENNQQLYVRVADRLFLVSTDKYTEVLYGDVLSFKGSLQKPEAFETDLGRTFNYKGYMQARGVEYSVAFADIQVLDSGRANFVIGALLQFKHAFMAHIEEVIEQPQVGLAEGLLLGVKKALGDELEDAFRTTGITHIVVLSGYNVMLVVTFVLYVLALIFPMRARIIFGIIAIALFACMVGLSATVVRASLMAALVLIAKATGRTYAVMRALMCTGIVMLIINPYLLAYDVGFQLSFIATLGLILVASHIEKYLGFMPTFIGLREFLTATLSAQIFVMPILLYQIGQFSVVAVVVNMLVLPMVPLAMFLTFITGLIAFISTTLAFPFAYLSYLSLTYIIFIAETFAKLPFAAFSVSAFSFYIVIIAYVILGFILWRLYMSKSKTKHIDKLSTWTTVDEKEYITLPLESNQTIPISFR